MFRAQLYLVLSGVLLASPALAQQQNSGGVILSVRGETGPAAQVEIQAGSQSSRTDERGEAILQLPPGEVEIELRRVGFVPKTVRTTILEGQTSRLTVELESESVLEEEILVTATRAGVRIQDEPLRVEVVDQEEVDEKAVMTPGDIAMLLNETGGLRVQMTSPSLGSANVRVQGLKGRYTQILADGLPLYGQTGSIGILQIPPLDLGQVEVIKGVASALYGSSALGGVINLVSRRPNESRRELLLNATSRRGSDTVFWLAEPKKETPWSYTLLAGAHIQGRSDIDDDGWSDLPEYQRGVLRPRLFWENEKGHSLFMTAGATIENRAGGSIDFSEELRTRRVDGGAVARIFVGKKLLSVRGSIMEGRFRRQFGTTRERERQRTFFGEAALSETAGAHTWTLGSAIQSDRYRNRDVSGFDYTYVTPSVFAQDEWALSPSITLSGSGRLDVHNRYGTFFSPRVSALFRLPHALTARLSTGTGVFAPTPFTEETEATGLSKIHPLGMLDAERAWSVSGDFGRKTDWLEWNATAFGSVIRHPVRLQGLDIVNAAGPTRTMGTEFVARLRHGRLNIVANHTYTHSTELGKDTNDRETVPLTPRHTAGFDAMWEDPDKIRIGFEVYYTGRQRLEDNPYRTASVPYWIFGILVERRFGPLRVFVNTEDLSDVRQTRHDPLVLPTPLPDGRRTVDAWAPLEGRVLNGGIRYQF